jgi:phosphoheptose isomerase
MSRFPDKRAESLAAFTTGYFAELQRAAATVSAAAVEAAIELVRDAILRDAQIFSTGNGGSAAIANHLVCDYGKGLRSDTGWRPRVRALTSGSEVLTAISNDIGYEESFSFQLEGWARPGDLLITISSSGDSENIVRAIEWAKANGIKSIGMTGFSGGRSAAMVDVNLHVASDNYGVVEDVHQSLMHLIGQYLRLSQMPEELIAQRKF